MCRSKPEEFKPKFFISSLQWLGMITTICYKSYTRGLHQTSDPGATFYTITKQERIRIPGSLQWSHCPLSCGALCLACQRKCVAPLRIRLIRLETWMLSRGCSRAGQHGDTDPFPSPPQVTERERNYLPPCVCNTNPLFHLDLTEQHAPSHP